MGLHNSGITNSSLNKSAYVLKFMHHKYNISQPHLYAYQGHYKPQASFMYNCIISDQL